MSEVAQGTTTDRILDAVVELLESDGYEGWSLPVVAREARVSLRDVYKLVPAGGDRRVGLIVVALRRWIEDHTDASTTLPEGVSLHDGLMVGLRRLVEPWEDHPRLLEAYHRVRLAPEGRGMRGPGLAAFLSIFRTLVDGLDRSYARDLGMTIANTMSGLIESAIRGEMPLTDVIPTLERTVHRLTSDNAALARTRKQGRPR
jgi:AcrR family transcriptional regulator